ncbi:aminoglycoside phosphotransferase family protein [Spongiactinospora sp. TRM90649]|uniref:aminoglycoside phosphotransferase family protein n=1 Tax=Spongiactinospora sp. TRM90649 TaxID=3031114 RepID=UPI0023F69B69|nr:aminoglycoside phosphotransferase family protein [Spongiactinospora sp. TRM90649]MDF5758810.1 aminoglycoside phosphotransferase family protein [Spongiactinospora sp. TRM90649]
MNDLYEAALQSRGGSSGFYNDNVRVDTETGPVVVRIPIAGADSMDLRLWPEQEVLATLTAHVSHAPRLLHVSQDPRFQVHEFIAGDLIADIAPRGRRLPPVVVHDVVELFVQLTSVPLAELPELPPSWPEDGDTVGFASLLSGITRQVYTTFGDEYRSLFSALGIPDDPLASVLARWPDLTPRPFGLIHTDVHRKNMILSDGRVVFLDWELALWGDPVYELAVHFHKMAYQEDEHAAVLGGWLDGMPSRSTEGWKDDLDIYLAHERVKSSIVDTVRYTQLIRAETLDEAEEAHLIRKLVAKLHAAGRVWQHDALITEAQVAALLREGDPAQPD